uniref:PH domain-containing protein n=1 Tax=Phaeomonas parva TaxID=124430 RepID=A0A7S1Y1G9_9STRA
MSRFWRGAAALVFLCSLSVARAQDPGDGGDDDEFSCPEKSGDSSKQYPGGKEECVPQWVVDGGFAGIIVVLAITFWGLAVICDEFFVPALNVLCDALNVPDDVAGATFMAAGASSPEVFSSLIALFVTKSEAGVGTVIGSEVFNMLCIVGGSVLYAENHVLNLDWRVLLRECTFYLLALISLLWTCWKSEEREIKAGSDDKGEYLEIQWYHGLVLMCLYFAYAVVCATYQSTVIPLLCPVSHEAHVLLTDDGNPYDVEGEFGAGDTTTAGISQLSTETENPHQTSMSDLSSPLLDGDAKDGETDPLVSDSLASASRGSPTTARNTMLPRTSSLMYKQGIQAEDLVQAISPGLYRQVHEREIDLFKVENGEVEETPIGDVRPLGCWLFKKSNFYSRTRVASKKWQLRWFVIDAFRMQSWRNPDTQTHVRTFNIYEATSVKVTDKEYNIFQLATPSREYTFRAPNEDIMHDCVRLLEGVILNYQRIPPQERSVLSKLSSQGDSAIVYEHVRGSLERIMGKDRESTHDLDDDEEVHDMMAWPHSLIGQFIHVVLFPLKFLLHISVPDVRVSKWPSAYKVSIITSVVWLSILSFVMVTAAELLGAFLGLTPR